MSFLKNTCVEIKQLYLRLIRMPGPLRRAQKFRDKGMQIGEGTYIFSNVEIGGNGRDPIRIGKHCVLTGCVILGHDASVSWMMGIKESAVKPVVIEDNCFIGFHAIVLMGVTVGKGSIVGAGAVVTKDVPPGSVVAGNPARVITTVEQLIEKRKEGLAASSVTGIS